MLDKLKKIAEKYKELETELSDPGIMKDMNRYKKVMREHSHLSEVVAGYEQYRVILEECNDAKQH